MQFSIQTLLYLSILCFYIFQSNCNSIDLSNRLVLLVTVALVITEFQKHLFHLLFTSEAVKSRGLFVNSMITLPLKQLIRTQLLSHTADSCSYLGICSHPFTFSSSFLFPSHMFLWELYDLCSNPTFGIKFLCFFSDIKYIVSIAVFISSASTECPRI